MTFDEYLQSVSRERFNDICFDIASRRENWARILDRCGSEIIEEFNDDAIDYLEAKWSEDHAIEENK